MDELLFTAMDIPKEARELLDIVEVTVGMSDSELKAYKMGVENAFGALSAILGMNVNGDGEPIVYVPGLKISEEMYTSELEEIFLK